MSLPLVDGTSEEDRAALARSREETDASLRSRSAYIGFALDGLCGQRRGAPQRLPSQEERPQTPVLSTARRSPDDPGVDCFRSGAAASKGSIMFPVSIIPFRMWKHF